MRQDAIKAFKSVEEPAESDELLAIRPQDEIQEQEEAAEYRRFLLEMGGGEEEVRKILGLDPAALTYGVLDEDEEQVENDGLEKTALSKVERRELKAKRRAAKTKTNEDFLMKYAPLLQLQPSWLTAPQLHSKSRLDRPIGESGPELRPDCGQWCSGRSRRHSGQWCISRSRTLVPSLGCAGGRRL